jgi:hypothetical protein
MLHTLSERIAANIQLTVMAGNERARSDYAAKIRLGKTKRALEQLIHSLNQEFRWLQQRSCGGHWPHCLQSFLP